MRPIFARFGRATPRNSRRRRGLEWQTVRSQLRRLRPPDTFPLAAPTWPGGVPRPPLERTLGTDYDTEWARRYPARLGRVLVSELVARPVVHALAAPRVAGLDRIAHLDEPVIFAANHASHLDAPLLLSVIPDRWRHRMFVAGAADYFFDTQAKAVTFAFLLNAVPIERQRVSRDSANRVAALLAEGWSLLIFPEGGRSPDGWGQPHRAGTAWLAVRTGRPVVPVHIEGTRQILAKGSARLRPGTAYVTFGRPLRAAAGGRPPRAGGRTGTRRGDAGRRTDHRLVDRPAPGRGRHNAGLDGPDDRGVAADLGAREPLVPVGPAEVGGSRSEVAPALSPPVARPSRATNRS